MDEILMKPILLGIVVVVLWSSPQARVITANALRKAWESESSGESAAVWGKRHYNTSGKAEGRQTDWISDDEGADWEGYIKSNKDLNDHWQSQGGDQTAAEFGESHWYSHGKEEGRTLNQQQAKNMKK